MAAEVLPLEEVGKLPVWVRKHFERDVGRMETPGWMEKDLKEALFGGRVEVGVEDVEKVRVSARMLEPKAMQVSSVALSLFNEPEGDLLNRR